MITETGGYKRNGDNLTGAQHRDDKVFSSVTTRNGTVNRSASRGSLMVASANLRGDLNLRHPTMLIHVETQPIVMLTLYMGKIGFM